MPVQTLLNGVTTPTTGTSLNCSGIEKAVFFFSTSFDGEVVFEATLDGVNWFVYPGRLVGGTFLDRLHAGNRAVYFDVEPLLYIRPKVTRVSSGSITCFGYVKDEGKRVQLTGSLPTGSNIIGKVDVSSLNVKHVKNVITTTPLAAGGSYMSSWFDLTSVDRGSMIGFMLYADTVTDIQIQADPGSDSPAATQGVPMLILRFAPLTTDKYLFIPFLVLPAARYRVYISNPTTSNQTVLYLAELYRTGNIVTPFTLKSWNIKNLAIRDTVSHTFSTDPAYISIFSISQALQIKNCLIWVKNALDQQVTISVTINYAPMSITLGTKSIPAGQTALITPQDFPALANSWGDMRLSAQCSVAPTTGTVDAMVMVQF